MFFFNSFILLACYFQVKIFVFFFLSLFIYYFEIINLFIFYSYFKMVLFFIFKRLKMKQEKIILFVLLLIASGLNNTIKSFKI